MPTGSFTYDPSEAPLASDAIPITVCLYDSSGGDEDDEEGSSPYTPIPNVRCEQIQYKEGIDPPTARFSYVLDEIASAASADPEDPESPTWPTQFDQIWPLGVTPSPYIVANADELVVLAIMPDGTTRVLFHGFARVPQTDVDPQGQHVSFVAAGVVVRCWEQPIGGRVQRNGDDPEAENEYVGLPTEVQTDLPTRFNPAGTGKQSIGGILPNCTPDGYDDYEGGESPYPVFLDPEIDRKPSPLTFWGLSKAVRYILGVWNTLMQADGIDLLVDNPDFGVLDALLQDRRPLDGAEFFDPTDPSTYQESPNVIRDYDATNKPWPEVVGELLGFYGFGMRFVCEDDENAEPYDYLEIYRKDASGPTDPKQIFLPPTGTLITEGQVNLSAFHAGFDYHSVANDVFVESHLERREISVVLAPGFPANPDDYLAANRTQFLNVNINSPNATAAQRLAYRYYIADECGDGHCRPGGDIVRNTPFDFSEIWPDYEGNPNESPGNGPVTGPGYVNRYRPGKNTLFSKDPLNRPHKAQLAISNDVYDPTNDVYDPTNEINPPYVCKPVQTGTWQEVSSNGWNLLPDRLGIIITVDDPETWNIGKPPNGVAPNGKPWPYPDGKVRGISAAVTLNDAPATKVFVLRLTTVIEGDFGLDTHAKRRDASPLSFTVQRRVDATDHFHYDLIDASSAYFPPGKNALSIKVRDDTTRALAHACQLRSAHEFPPLAASLEIPMLDFSLEIGDRISRVNGRDVSLLTNSGSEQQEPPSYPYVVAKTWNFEGAAQKSIYQLSDRRLEPSRHLA